MHFAYCRFQGPRGLRRRSAVARLLKLWVRIPPEAWMSVCCECCLLRRADCSSRGVLPTLVRCCVQFRNFVSEEDLAHWGLSRQKQTSHFSNLVLSRCVFIPNVVEPKCTCNHADSQHTALNMAGHACKRPTAKGDRHHLCIHLI